jgi:hypothetical protein
MSLDKAIKHGKEKRKPTRWYRCRKRGVGLCERCLASRQYRVKRQQPIEEKDDE